MAAQPPLPTAEDKWRDCLSPTMLRGSDAGNKIPDSAEMSFSLRFTETDGCEKWLNLLRETTGCEASVFGAYRLPVVSDPENADVQRLLGALKRRCPAMRLGRMSAATDASYYAHLRLPTVIYAPTGQGSHGAVEWISLKSLDDYADALTEFVGGK